MTSRHKSGGNGLGIAAVGVVGLTMAWPTIQAMLSLALTIVTWAAGVAIGVGALVALWQFVIMPYLENKEGQRLDEENRQRASQPQQGTPPGHPPRPAFAPPLPTPRPPIPTGSPNGNGNGQTGGQGLPNPNANGRPRHPQPTGNGQGNGKAPPRWPGDRNGRPRHAKPAGQGANGQHHPVPAPGTSESPASSGNEKL